MKVRHLFKFWRAHSGNDANADSLINVLEEKEGTREFVEMIETEFKPGKIEKIIIS